MSPPRVYRTLIPAYDLPAARRFYETLLGIPGRPVAPGRVYFDTGPIVLGVLDFSQVPDRERIRPAEAIYFATDELEAIHERARSLRCLSQELLHGDPESPMGEIVVRPWAERSFYVEDPSGNALCFVDDRTLFTGTPKQVAALEKTTRTSGGPRGSRRGARPPHRRSR